MPLFREVNDTAYENNQTQNPSMDFSVERNCFKHLKTNLDDEAKTEYELAVKHAIIKYNTYFRENRFIFGGILEIFTLALMRSTDIVIDPCGQDAIRGDLILDTGQMFSLKSNMTGSGAITLINKMGDGYREWETATLFVLANYGIVYGDPKMVEKDKDLSQGGDRLDIKRSTLTRLASDSSNLIRMDIPVKPKPESTDLKRIESEAIAREMMEELNLIKLLGQLDSN